MIRLSDIVAQLSGKSHGTIDKIKDIAKAAKENPEQFGRIMDNIDKGDVSINYGHNERGELIAGQRRVEACKRLGWTSISCAVVNMAEVSYTRIL